MKRKTNNKTKQKIGVLKWSRLEKNRTKSINVKTMMLTKVDNTASVIFESTLEKKE